MAPTVVYCVARRGRRSPSKDEAEQAQSARCDRGRLSFQVVEITKLVSAIVLTYFRR